MVFFTSLPPWPLYRSRRLWAGVVFYSTRSSQTSGQENIEWGRTCCQQLTRCGFITKTCGVVRYGMVLCGAVWCGAVRCGMCVNKYVSLYIDRCICICLNQNSIDKYDFLIRKKLHYIHILYGFTFTHIHIFITY